MTDAVARLQAALEAHYRLERELGQGGMATVYLAHDVKHDRDVALKVLRPELAAVLGAPRFLAEIKITARLDHPHILTLIDSGESNGLLWYVLPFVHGESLRERLNREGQLPLEDALLITRQVASALDYAHREGVIHRDIKPENILLHEGEAMLADFGIALAVREAGGSRLTETGLSLGTPQYMSPEQATGDRQLDARSDVYSLGAVLYEMLAGEPPVTGPTAQAVIAKLLTERPTRLRSVRDTVPDTIEAAVAKALARTPADRFGTIHEFASALEMRSTAGTAALPKAGRRRWVVVVGLLVLVIAALIVSKTARVVWARARALPRLQSLVAAGDWEEAYSLARRLDAVIPNDTNVAALRSVFADTVTITGTPIGARVFRKGYAASPNGWEYLGTSPINRILLPRLPTVSLFRFEANGFVTAFDIDGASSPPWNTPVELRFALTPVGQLPAGMVRVPGGLTAPDIAKLSTGDSATVQDFFLDRLEVTNQQYQEFVDSGGYRRRELWENDFVANGRRLSWADGIARFVDQTGRPGPSTWEAGRYPPGQADRPVGGLSWYEAAAYAKFRGKRLPTVFEWWRAAKLPAAGAITGASNIQNVREGTVPVGSLSSLNGYGAMDMAGNVREWCFNTTTSSDDRFILGGGWNDPAYAFFEPAIAAPFDRAATNGIRLVLPVSGAETSRSSFRPVELLFRNYRVERPVPDRTFQIYRGLFAYDPSPLHARSERPDSSQQWVTEKVSYDAAYGGERMAAYVYLPLNGHPPYQTVVYFPGASALATRSSASLNGGNFDFLVRAGRAVVYPIYKGTYERGDGTRHSDPDSTNAYEEHVIMWERDVSRTLDYLATRRDMDTSRVAYLGVSWGGRFGGVVMAIEPRLKAAVLVVAGLSFRRSKPEVDDLNYLPHVHAPVLMINGRYDFTFPLETAAQPMFNFLGTPPDRKRNVVVDGVHYVPRHDLIRETLAWLDHYLGPVR